jgi:hypothetical protein
MREIRQSGSEGGETELNRSSLPLSLADEGFRRQKEPEQQAEDPEAGHADRQAVQAGSAGQAATIQTGTACEGREGEAEGL